MQIDGKASVENVTRLGYALHGICCSELFAPRDLHEDRFGKYLASKEAYSIVNGKLVFRAEPDVLAFKIAYA